MIELVVRHVLPAAFDLLPPAMRSKDAGGMLLTIGLQESRFLRRRQIVGPARGFWQFERAGVAGVMQHRASREPLRDALRRLRYQDEIDEEGLLHAALEHNDVLAAVFARLLLWTLPGKLPTSEQSDEGWRQYLEAWRPGKPHPQTWAPFFTEAHDRLTFHDFRSSRNA